MKKVSTVFDNKVFIRSYRFHEKEERLKKCGSKDWWRLSWFYVDGFLIRACSLKYFWGEKNNVNPSRDSK